MRTRTDIPAQTLAWLTSPENPAVAVLTRRELLGEPESEETRALWTRRNSYTPVATILDALPELLDASPRTPDYQKYHGPL